MNKLAVRKLSCIFLGVVAFVAAFKWTNNFPFAVMVWSILMALVIAIIDDSDHIH
jgi:hypothetical protein